VRISVLGGTGYAGEAIVAEAVGRGHDVTALSRNVPADPIPGVTYLTGTAAESLDRIIAESAPDILVGALSAKGSTLGTLVQTYRDAGGICADLGVRMIVIGGFGSLRMAPGEPRVITGIDDLDVPPARVAEGKEMEDVREALATQAPADLDWLFVCPAAVFGSYTDLGPARGIYRTSDDIALFDPDGNSAIEAADLALAVIDQIEKPSHHRTQIHFAY
jgi:putative NADH-flavin reductase